MEKDFHTCDILFARENEAGFRVTSFKELQNCMKTGYAESILRKSDASKKIITKVCVNINREWILVGSTPDDRSQSRRDYIRQQTGLFKLFRCCDGRAANKSYELER